MFNPGLLGGGEGHSTLRILTPFTSSLAPYVYFLCELPNIERMPFLSLLPSMSSVVFGT